MAELPNRIRELRTQRDWSQDWLADRAGCSKMQISDLERGNKALTLDWMRRLAKIFGVAPAELLREEDNPLILSEQELALIERFRAGTTDQRDNLARVSEALIPYRIGKKDAA